MIVDAVFLVGAPRSATTSLSTMFEHHPDCESFVEQEPKLLKESRLKYEGRINETGFTFIKNKQAFIKSAKSRKKIYVDKNPNYMPFVQNLLSLWDSKIVLIIRDGRDVVRSMMDWNHYHSKSFFCLPEDWPEHSPEIAPENERSIWDYSRFRPLEDNPVKDNWKFMTRFEKCAWYWAEFYRYGMNQLGGLEKDNWMILKTSGMSSLDINRMFSFLGLTTLQNSQVEMLIDARINSVKDRFGGEKKFPSYEDWDNDLISSFVEYAGDIQDKYFK